MSRSINKAAGVAMLLFCAVAACLTGCSQTFVTPCTIVVDGERVLFHLSSTESQRIGLGLQPVEAVLRTDKPVFGPTSISMVHGRDGLTQWPIFLNASDRGLRNLANHPLRDASFVVSTSPAVVVAKLALARSNDIWTSTADLNACHKLAFLTGFALTALPVSLLDEPIQPTIMVAPSASGVFCPSTSNAATFRELMEEISQSTDR